MTKEEVVQPWEVFGGMSLQLKRKVSRTDRKAKNRKAVAKRRKARKALKRK